MDLDWDLNSTVSNLHLIDFLDFALIEWHLLLSLHLHNLLIQNVFLSQHLHPDWNFLDDFSLDFDWPLVNLLLDVSHFDLHTDLLFQGNGLLDDSVVQFSMFHCYGLGILQVAQITSVFSLYYLLNLHNFRKRSEDLKDVVDIDETIELSSDHSDKTLINVKSQAIPISQPEEFIEEGLNHDLKVENDLLMAFIVILIDILDFQHFWLNLHDLNESLHFFERHGFIKDVRRHEFKYLFAKLFLQVRETRQEESEFSRHECQHPNSVLVLSLIIDSSA